MTDLPTYNGMPPLTPHRPKSPSLIDEINARWKSNSQNTYYGLCAMRDDINNVVPMPSLESDLLQGPENSVSCSVIAVAVIKKVKDQQAKIAELENALAAASGTIAAMRADAAKGQARIAQLAAALNRQGDNMAFVLNHMDVKNWYTKFTTELAEDRAALKPNP